MAISSGQITFEVLSITVLLRSRCLPDFEEPEYIWMVLYLPYAIRHELAVLSTVTKPIKGHRTV